MTLTLSPVVTDSFTPAANPLNPANWSGYSGGISPLQATSGVAAATTLGATCAEFNKQMIGANQYVQVKLASWTPLNNQALALVLRSSTDLSTGYELSVVDNGDGTSSYDISSLVGPISLYDGSLTVAVDDVYVFAVVGNSLYFLQNGVPIVNGSPANNAASSGSVGLVVDSFVALTDAEVSNFVAGSASTGAISVGTVELGQVFGANFAEAFSNPTGLDVMQVVNEGGKVVWNLDKSGNAASNPVSPTRGALNVYFGSSFLLAFSSGNPNNLDVLQVVNQGGSVVFNVDYQGNAVSH